MNSQITSAFSRREDNLRKAREAEQMAEQVSDQAAKNVWLRIAKGYLDLANLVPRPHTSATR